jgi:hypothetical protein
VLEMGRITGVESTVPVSAGFLTGAIFNHARGPRAAVLSGVIGSIISTAYFFGGSYAYSLVFGKSGGRY